MSGVAITINYFKLTFQGRFMRYYYCFLLFISLSLSVFAEDTLPVKHHYVSVDVISVCFGTLLGNYEYKWGNHGFFMEGEYTFPMLGTKAYAGTLAYRYHFKPTTIGGFIGPYWKYGKSEASIADESKTKFSYVLKYTTIGADWGYRENLWKKHRLYYTLRLGAGYPFSTLTWKDGEPGSIGGLSRHTLYSILKIASFFDGELTLTFAL